METPTVIKNIDWALLREQKKALVTTITYLTQNKVPTVPNDLEGILQLIDSLQDYAVDELGMSENYIFDIEDEERREKETPEEKFARENSEILFEMAIEGEFLYMDDTMSKEFIEGIVEDAHHASAIKNVMRLKILRDVQNYPDNFTRDENGNLTYSPDMMDYNSYITEYCLKEYYKDKTKTLYLCPNCGSDNVEFKVWAKANYGKEINDDCPTNDSDSWCGDCETHGELLVHDIPYLKEVIGYQVVGVEGSANEGEIHPNMDGSFCIYNLSQTKEMLESSSNDWKLLTIWSDDVEEPTFMFEGNPRG